MDGLQEQVAMVSGRSMVVAEDRSWRFDASSPQSMLTGGLLRGRDLVPAVRGGWAARRGLAARPTCDLGRWSDLEGRNGVEWAEARFGRGLTRRLLSPAVHGLYFQELEANSAALPGALAAIFARAGSAFTLRGGLGTLVTALAARGTLSTRSGSTASNGRVPLAAGSS